MPGSQSYGFHEGCRSEYLAQYVFASLGTAVAIPHHEDHGLDLFCTLMEHAGNRWLARHPYTVQVKSDWEPWVFKDAEEVRWFIHHPLPFYFCVVDKATARLSVYHTFPRFFLWSLGTVPASLELVPTPCDGSEGKSVQWEGTYTRFPLGQPILDFSITQMLDTTFWHQARKAFGAWVDEEVVNLTRIRTGLLKYRMPMKYKTNEGPTRGWVSGSFNYPTEEQVKTAKDRMKESLEWITMQLLRRQDFEGAVRGALLHRHLFRDAEDCQLSSVYHELEQRLGACENDYFFKAIDDLGKMLDRLVAKQKADDP